jgi:hypothetical protein
MRQFGFLIAGICAFIAFVMLYLWLNGLALTWQAVVFGALPGLAGVLTNMWFARRRERQERRMLPRAPGKPANGLLGAGALLLFCGVMVFVSGWRLIDAVLTGRVTVSTTPDIYTAWASNPWGFAFTLALGIVIALFFLVGVIVSIFMIGDAIERRRFARR